MHKNITADEFAAAVEDPDFLQQKHILIITNASKLPGFSSSLKRHKLDSDNCVEYVLGGYPEKITRRQHLGDWTVSIWHQLDV